MNREQKEELASLHALGLLSPEEARDFERQCAEDPELAGLARDFAETATAIALSVPQSPAPERLRSAIFDRIRPSATESRILLAWIPWTLAACLAIFCGILFNAKSRLEKDSAARADETRFLRDRLAVLDGERAQLESRNQTLNAQKASLQDRVAALERERKDLATKLAALEKRDPFAEIVTVNLVPQDKAFAGSEVTALWDNKRKTGILDPAKLPPAAAGKDYQLWIIDPKLPAPVSAGVFKPADGGRYAFQPSRKIGEAAALAISLEPAGGSEPVARGPVILIGKL